MKDTKQVKKLKNKLLFFIASINFIIILCSYIIIPIIFNYPPYAENDLKFQNELEKINHLQQYLIIFIIATVIFSNLINLLMKNIYNYLNKYYNNKEISPDEYIKVRRDCINVPYEFFVAESIGSLGLAIMIISFFSINKTSTIILKFAFVLFAIIMLISLLQFIFLQKHLKGILQLTFKEYKIIEKSDAIRIRFSTNLIVQIIPFLAVSIIIISLIGYAKTTNEKGNSIMNYYKAYFENRDFEIVSMDNLIQELDSIPLNSPSDYYIIIPPDRENAYTSINTTISDFFFKYLDYYFYKTNGRIYEYYGTEQQAYMIELKDENDDSWYIGFEYLTSDMELLKFYVSIIWGVSLLYIIFLYFWSRNISTKISTISESLEHILEENDYTTQQFLPILSNDEFGDLAYSYNKIEELTNQHLKEIQDNQDMMIEQERLASLRPNDWWYCTQSKNTYFFCCRWFRRFIRFNK